MRTDAKLKEALRNLMMSKPLEDINVTTLCKKCNIHRQTFYYHYQDIYDLLSAILLNENIVGLKEAQSTFGVIESFIKYTSKNLKFIQATYNSSAKGLVEELYFGRIRNKMLIILANSIKDLTKADCRIISRRFSNYISEEFLHCVSDQEITPTKLEKQLKKFGDSSIEIVLPSIIESYKKEKQKNK